MKSRVLSDLHLEFTGYSRAVRGVGEDLVILAGDIGLGARGVEWAMRSFRNTPVVYIAGNHEFYGQDWSTLIDQCKQVAANSNVNVLENDAVVIDGLRILGCTLWTDFRSPSISRADARHQAFWSLSDYEEITVDGKRRLNAVDTQKRCAKSRWWLRQQIRNSHQPTLVVTHHAPTFQTLDPKHLGSALNPAFHSKFHRLIRPPVLRWIHGHTHHSSRKLVRGIPVLSNQRGYPSEKLKFNWAYTIDITVGGAP